MVCIEGDKFTVIDVGEAEKVKERIDTHDRKDCWEQNCKSGTIKFGVHYTSNMTDEKRREIEGKIRNSPRRTVLCGEK